MHLNNELNLYAEFATKKELALVDSKVDELVKSGASMAEAIKALTKSVDGISEDIKKLVENKAYYTGMRVFAVKCGCVVGSVISIILAAHQAGIIKIISKYILH